MPLATVEIGIFGIESMTVFAMGLFRIVISPTAHNAILVIGHRL